MPNVLRVDGFLIVIYFPPTEHGPPHVHVSKAGGSAVIMLPVGHKRIEVRESYGMSPANVRKVVAIVEANADLLIVEWRKIHG
jgi:hypothetical protein